MTEKLEKRQPSISSKDETNEPRHREANNQDNKRKRSIDKHEENDSNLRRSSLSDLRNPIHSPPTRNKRIRGSLSRDRPQRGHARHSPSAEDKKRRSRSPLKRRVIGGAEADSRKTIIDSRENEEATRDRRSDRIRRDRDERNNNNDAPPRRRSPSAASREEERSGRGKKSPERRRTDDRRDEGRYRSTADARGSTTTARYQDARRYDRRLLDIHPAASFVSRSRGTPRDDSPRRAAAMMRYNRDEDGGRRRRSRERRAAVDGDLRQQTRDNKRRDSMERRFSSVERRPTGIVDRRLPRSNDREWYRNSSRRQPSPADRYRRNSPPDSSGRRQQKRSLSRKSKSSDASSSSTSSSEDEADMTEDQLMAKLMGVTEFNTTKNKNHSKSDISGVNKKTKRRYRQYMNRRGGFNRPLSPVL